MRFLGARAVSFKVDGRPCNNSTQSWEGADAAMAAFYTAGTHFDHALSRSCGCVFGLMSARCSKALRKSTGNLRSFSFDGMVVDSLFLR